MKILCLFVRHGTGKYPDALPLLDAWYDTHGLRENRLLWIIDNARPTSMPPQLIGPDRVLRSGNNLAWEFSAWEKALRDAEAEGVQCDLVHCVTSAFNTLYTRYLDHFFPQALQFVLQHNICLGHIDSYDRPVEFAGNQSQSWIRTCFFFLPFPSACSLMPWAAFSDAAVLFDSPATTQFRTTAPIAADYQERIRIWLTGQTVGGHVWHSPIGPDPDEAGRFQKKAMAIINEHSLAVTMRTARLRLIDFCWLYTLHRTLPDKIYELPTEQEQLKTRRQVLMIPESPL